MKAFTERQAQIIQESIKLIADKGIQGVTIKNISKAIGISEPAIYRHFENKNKILLGIISTLKDIDYDDHDQEKENAIIRIKTFFRRYTARFIENPSLTAIVFSEEIFNNESYISMSLKEMMKKKQEKLNLILTYGQANSEIRKDLDARQMSIIAIGSFRFLISNWRFSNYSFELEKEVEKLLNSLEILLT
jgi:AcrR family transcriptional regulator